MPTVKLELLVPQRHVGSEPLEPMKDSGRVDQAGSLYELVRVLPSVAVRWRWWRCRWRCGGGCSVLVVVAVVAVAVVAVVVVSATVGW